MDNFEILEEKEMKIKRRRLTSTALILSLVLSLFVPAMAMASEDTLKPLPKVGDVSILGIVAKKAPLSYPLFNLTRLGAVYSMADIIAGAISDLTSDQLVNKSQICV